MYNESEMVPVQCDHEEGDVNIQCLQSSEFVVGKQTNFNGPVTLINCVKTQGEGNPQNKKKHNQEKIIIRDKVWSQSGAMTGQNDPKKEVKRGEDGPPKKFPQKVLNKLKKLPMIPVIVCCGLIAAGLIAFTVFLVITSTGEPEGVQIGSHLLYTKKAWGGRPPRSIIEMKLPLPYAVVSHTVTPQCFHLKACTFLIQNMQDYHMNIDFADIGYNFLVDSSGNIYEGRGWNIRNVKGGFVNGRNIDIALIGDYSDNAFPTDGIMEGLKDLLEFGVENGKLLTNYSLIAANSTFSTLSPGVNVYTLIKHWPNFDPDPKSHVMKYEN